MPAFLKSRRNQLIIGAAVIVLLIAGGVLYFATRTTSRGSSSSSGSAATSPSPSSPLSPTPAASAITASTSPGGLGPVIGGGGAFLKTGQAPDDAASAACPGTCFGQNSGGGCGAWHHTDWTSDGCDIVVIGGTADRSMAWVTEHRNSDSTARRVSIMKTGPSGAWGTVLYAVDDVGGSFTAITIKAADLVGDGQQEIFVGIRIIGNAHVLELDGVQRTTGLDPAVVIHRELAMGRAVLSAGSLTDYDATGASYTKTVIQYSGGAFHGNGSTVAAGAVPSGDFA